MSTGTVECCRRARVSEFCFTPLSPKHRDPAVIADLAKRTLRRKIADLTEALVGPFTEHHAFMARLFLDRIDAHSADIGRLDARIEEAMAPFRLARELLISIPGFSTKTVEVFIAETGGDMSVFPSAGHLASWAGVSPGSNQSAGRIKSTKTCPGNPYLKGALGVSAMSAARSKNTFFCAKYQRIGARQGRSFGVAPRVFSVVEATISGRRRPDQPPSLDWLR